jgi:hypothetical protein
MALTTITFEELRERNEHALNKAGYDPNGSVAPMRAAQRTRIETLLDQRTEIENLSSTQQQREEYGVEQWHRDFVRLRDVHSDPVFKKFEGQELRDYIWNWVPNCPFKRFQQLFSRSTDLIVPPFQISKNGRVEFAVPPIAIGVRGCLVSPDHIPEKLAEEDLGLCDFSDDHGDPLERLKKKREIIPRLKLLFDAAVPLENRHYRLLAIEEPLPGLQATYGDEVVGPPLHTLGSIIYTHEEVNGNGETPRRRGAPPHPTWLTAQYFDSAYSAQRKTLHEANVYGDELQVLTQAKSDLRDMNGRLDREWKLNKDQLRTEARALIQRCLDIIGRPMNRSKVEARDLLERSADLKDVREKENISATMSRMIGVIDRLEGRLTEMRSKGAYNFHDDRTLEQKIREHERTIEAFRRAVAGSEQTIHDDSRLFGLEALTNEEIETEVATMKSRLAIWPGNLERLTLEPFRTFADKLHILYDTLDASLYARDRKRTIDALVRLHVTGKFQEVRTCFAEIERLIINPDRTSIESLKKIVDKLLGIFATRDLFPTHIVEGFRTPFEEMETTLNIIAGRFAHYKKEKPDAAERDLIYDRLKKYLEKFDVEAIVRDLPDEDATLVEPAFV